MGTADVSIKVAPTVAGEVAVMAGVWTVTCVGQHVAFKISFSDERTSANPTLVAHLQNRKHTSVSLAKRSTLTATASRPTQETTQARTTHWRQRWPKQSKPHFVVSTSSWFTLSVSGQSVLRFTLVQGFCIIIRDH